MNSKTTNALSSFDSGLNCAQSVLKAYADELNSDASYMVDISTGFGAGMGRLQETCGAVTGAFMAFGLYNAKKYSNNDDKKEKTYAMIQQFSKEFKATHGTLRCKSLLDCDLTTEEGRKYAKENNLFKKVCEKCIVNAIAIADKLILESEK